MKDFRFFISHANVLAQHRNTKQSILYMKQQKRRWGRKVKAIACYEPTDELDWIVKSSRLIQSKLNAIFYGKTIRKDKCCVIY